MLDEIVCPTDCDAVTLPVVSFDDCNPEINKSEIVAVFIALSDAVDFDDVSDPLEWAARLSQTANPPAVVGGGTLTPVKDLIRRLTVIADKPASTETTKAISNNRTITVDRPRVINITIDEVNDDNYDLARSTECGNGISVKAWYLTAGGYLYGGASGIKNGIGGTKPVLKLNVVLDRGVDAIETITGTITWSNLQSESRVLSPI